MLFFMCTWLTLFMDLNAVFFSVSSHPWENILTLMCPLLPTFSPLMQGSTTIYGKQQLETLDLPILT